MHCANCCANQFCQLLSVMLCIDCDYAKNNSKGMGLCPAATIRFKTDRILSVYCNANDEKLIRVLFLASVGFRYLSDDVVHSRTMDTDRRHILRRMSRDSDAGLQNVLYEFIATKL